VQQPEPRPELTAAIYDSLIAFNKSNHWPELRLAQIRQHLAEHLAADLASVPAAVSAGPAPATDRAALREALRRAVCEAEGFAWDSDMLEPDEYGDHADAVLAVLNGEEASRD
jgi:hypothetical protein